MNSTNYISPETRDRMVEAMEQIRAAAEKRGFNPSALNTFGYPNIAVSTRMQIAGVERGTPTLARVYFPLLGNDLCVDTLLGTYLESDDFHIERLLGKISSLAKGIDGIRLAARRRVSSSEIRSAYSIGELLTLSPPLIASRGEFVEAHERWWQTSPQARLVQDTPKQNIGW